MYILYIINTINTILKMINRYRKGANFERKIVNDAKADGKLAFRSAGSKSPIDVCIIDLKNKKVEFVQAKTGSGNLTKSELEEFKFMSGKFDVEFRLERGK